MFGSTVLEVAIGLTFCYGTMALVVSTLQEALAAAFSLRANMLLAAIKRMLDDPRCEALAQSLYDHPLVNPHGSTKGRTPLAVRPSYIEPAHFAIALLDSLRTSPAIPLQAAIEALPDEQVRRVLLALYRQSGGDLQRFQDGIAGWFNSAMERLSGVYKRRQLLISFLLAMLLTIMLNVDSIHLFQTLWQNPALAAQIKGAPGMLDAETLRQLWELPIGWTTFPPVFDTAFALQVAGWFITAGTTLFGAPFWFDLLQRAVQLRSTGAKPQEKRTAPDGTLAQS
ncbi:hypothetical protein [Massilia yuzhufengensis]|uniref:Uncharacterized protein n=1 Tax=Massilia yuzhufengensis TaxID=1164594 RepID=A0A1I1LH59_9BURK|nr:hypothetical protein [Massilia yuzhufengensis]SFC72331.1 hypothetical protein SAMN05216204_10993 [Massilia yuzhufengensis]